MSLVFSPEKATLNLIFTDDFRSRDKEQKGQITIGYEDLIQLILKNM